MHAFLGACSRRASRENVARQTRVMNGQRAQADQVSLANSHRGRFAIDRSIDLPLHSMFRRRVATHTWRSAVHGVGSAHGGATALRTTVKGKCQKPQLVSRANKEKKKGRKEGKDTLASALGKRRGTRRGTRARARGGTRASDRASGGESARFLTSFAHAYAVAFGAFQAVVADQRSSRRVAAVSTVGMIAFVSLLLSAVRTVAIV